MIAVAPSALRACANAIRAYIHAWPGLASATWLAPTNKDKEWSDGLESVACPIRKALNECGLHGEAAQYAMHWLRGLVRGYVVHEMTGSFVKPVGAARGIQREQWRRTSPCRLGPSPGTARTDRRSPSPRIGQDRCKHPRVLCTIAECSLNSSVTRAGTIHLV